MKAKEKKRRSVAPKLQMERPDPVITVPVWCADGLCKGEIFQAEQGTKKLHVIIPMNPFYKIAVYRIDNIVTSNGEYVAIFLYGVPR